MWVVVREDMATGGNVRMDQLRSQYLLQSASRWTGSSAGFVLHQFRSAKLRRISPQTGGLSTRDFEMRTTILYLLSLFHV